MASLMQGKEGPHRKEEPQSLWRTRLCATLLTDPNGDLPRPPIPHPTQSPCYDRYGNVARGPNCLAASAGANSVSLCTSCLGCRAGFPVKFIPGCLSSCVPFLFFDPYGFLFFACAAGCLEQFTFDIEYCVYGFLSCLNSPGGAVRACCFKPPFSS
jgi:hypothetical protein